MSLIPMSMVRRLGLKLNKSDTNYNLIIARTKQCHLYTRGDDDRESVHVIPTSIRKEVLT